MSDRKFSDVDISGYGSTVWPKSDIAAWATSQLDLTM